MQTTAREIIKDFYLSDAADGSPIVLTDSGDLLGDHPTVPALECGGYALVMGDDTGEDGNEAAHGYMFTTYVYRNLDDSWEPRLESQYAADEEEARQSVAAWFDGLPA